MKVAQHEYHVWKTEIVDGYGLGGKSYFNAGGEAVDEWDEQSDIINAAPKGKGKGMGDLTKYTPESPKVTSRVANYGYSK